jgi:hypothetical protein
MAMESELAKLATEIGALESKFVESHSLGHYLRTEDAAEFKRLVMEATSFLSSTLGPGNAFTANVIHTVNAGSGGFVGGPSLAVVRETRALLEGAINHLARIETLKRNTKQRGVERSEYVSPARIAELESIGSAPYDVARLAQLCRELNAAHENGSLMSVAILVRAIVDHVPPIFGQSSFGQIANNYAGSKSFKASMQHLDNSLRNIADAHLHTQIRPRESLPTEQQVDFKGDLDVLLSEAVRLLK